MNKYVKLYPRPQFKRQSFQSLDGYWTLNSKPINVPFPKEADLSEYKNDTNNIVLNYTKSFILNKELINRNNKIILHFGAVDQECTVYLNDNLLGKHIGGYLPFSFDITDYLKNENELRVIAIDDLDQDYPYGKQTKKPSGMWYTPVSGIWGSVWLENVPKENSINSIKIDVNLKSLTLNIDSDANIFDLTIDFKTVQYKKTFNSNIINIEFDKLDIPYEYWSTENPVIYNFSIETSTDKIESYFVIRELSVKEVNGYQRLFLNNKPIFLHGVLDQGYFEEGIYLPEDPKEYLNDILRMKELGFNLLRKHIKIEPEIFYYYCDTHGMLVFQDMVNNGQFDFIKKALLPTMGFDKIDDTKKVNNKRYDIFINHSIETIKHLYNHPSIIGWTIYNEGWGQQNSDKAYKTLKALDPNRLFDSTSGWYKQNFSDFDSYHIYFRNKVLNTTDKNKVLFLSEFGGISRYVKGHVFKKRKVGYGYGRKDNEEELSKAILETYNNMVIPSIKNGLSACVYTQVSDVEEEINGFYTYDRKVLKVNKDIMLKIKNMIDDEYLNSLK